MTVRLDAEALQHQLHFVDGYIDAFGLLWAGICSSRVYASLSLFSGAGENVAKTLRLNSETDNCRQTLTHADAVPAPS